MEETTTEQPTIYQHALKWGLIVAGVSVFITILLYIIDYTVMIQLKFGLLSLLLYLGLTIYAGINYRNSIGGFLPYGKAFQHGFIVLAISGLVGTIFGFILYNVIDPELPQKLVDASIDNTREIMEKFGASGDQADEALEKARTEAAGRFTLVGQIKGYAWILVVSAVIALITSIFVKKNQPVEMV
jgi:hypothetical protein